MVKKKSCGVPKIMKLHFNLKLGKSDVKKKIIPTNHCNETFHLMASSHKFTVVISHPSNHFFARFPNYLTYANKEEFVSLPLCPRLRRHNPPIIYLFFLRFSWNYKMLKLIHSGLSLTCSLQESDHFHLNVYAGEV